MDKILKGVIKFRKNVRSDLVQQFQEIKDHPNVCPMSSAQFKLSAHGCILHLHGFKNVTYAVYSIQGFSTEVSVTTEPAALELAVKRGGIRHVIVCGHSDCKAMNLLYGLHQCPKNFDVHSPMDHWVRKNGFRSIKRLNERLHNGSAVMEFRSDVSPSQDFDAIIDPFDTLPAEDKLSQINVLQQVMNVASHEFLKEYFESGRLFAHAMWFDIYKGENYLFSREKRRFIPINEDTVEHHKAEIARRCGTDEIIEKITEKEAARC